MDNEFILSPGTYFLGDPSIVIQKKGDAIKFINQLWDHVYEDRVRFKKIVVDQITFYIMKSISGDGVYQGISTDSGVISLIDCKDLKNENLFRIPKAEKGFKWLVLHENTIVYEKEGILEIQNHIKIDTNS
ncbi:MAG: hypothetical protein V3569_03875 [Acholeplasmataceae bacterium]|nr:hypothetical protein [Acholeplasmataceae bacterium]